MVKHTVRLTLVLLLIAGGVFLVRHYTRPKPLEVLVKAVDRGAVERTVANTRAGTVKACRRARMSPSAGGQIASLPVKKGQRVTRGQLLMELWNRDLRAQVLLARREVDAAGSRSRSVCLKADLARRNADRLLALRKKQVGTEELSDTAEAEAAAMEAECAGAGMEIRVREARLEAAEAALERTRLFAPFDGVIAEINGELSEYVTPSPLGIATPPVVDIIDTACFYVAAPIDEVDAAAVRMGMPVRITLDAYGNRIFPGHVRRIADYVLDLEKQARTVEVEASLDRGPEGENLFLAGYSADVEVILEVRDPVVRVPTEALIEGRRVFVLEGTPGTLREVTVGTGLANWDWTEVLEGLSPGDRVVVNVDRPGLAGGVRAVPIREEP